MSLTTDGCRKWFKEDRFELADDTELSLLPDGRLTRFVECQDRAEADALAKFLRDYTDPANSSRKAWIANPKCKRKTFTGTFRAVSVQIEAPDAQGQGERTAYRIVQVLAKGFLTALTNAEARLVESRDKAGAPSGTTNGSQAAEQYRTIRWVGVDPDTAVALAAGLNTQDTVSIAARKWDTGTTVDLGSGWYHVFAVAALAEDGSATVTRLVAKSRFDVHVFNDLGTQARADTQILHQVPKQLAQGIIDTWRAAYPKGSSASESYDSTGATCEIRLSRRIYQTITLGRQKTGENCEFDTYRTWYMGIEDPYQYPVPAGRPVGTTYDRDVQDHRDGSYTVVITERVRKHINEGEYTGAEDKDAKTRVKQDRGVADLSTVDTSTDVAEAAVDLVIRTDADCTKEVTRRKTTGKNQTAISNRRDHAEDVVEQLDTHADQDGTPALLPGQTVETEHLPNRFGKKRRVRRVVTAKNQTGKTYRRDHAEDVTEDLDTQGDSEGAPALAPGQTAETVQEPTRAGKTRKVRRITIYKNQTGTAREVSRFGTRVVTTQTQADALAAASFVLGQVIRQDNVPTRAGRHATRQETETPAKNIRQVFTYWDRNGKGKIIICRNGETATLLADLDSLTGATNNSVSVQETEAGYFDYRIDSVPYRSSSGGGADTNWDAFEALNIDQEEILYAEKFGVRYWAAKTYKIDVKQTRSASVAWNYINGGNDGSRVDIVGPDRYRAIKVHTVVFPSSWTSMGGP